MENITLGQIYGVIAFLGTFIAGVISLLVWGKKLIHKALEDDLKGIKENIENNELQTCTNFVVSTIETAEREGQLNETVKQRFYEQYYLYTNKFHKNGYIHKHVEDLQKRGIL